MQVWRPLLIIVPAGLALGVVGGYYARPVMLERPVDGSLQALFETRAQRYGTSDLPTQPEDATYYSGGYSYPPYLDDSMTGDDKSVTGWQGPDFADWPEYKPAPMPTVAELKAQLAARDAALAQRAMSASDPNASDESATDVAAEGAGEAVVRAGDDPEAPDADTPQDTGHPKVVVLSPAAPAAEPPTADGNLPAIW
jgi:hypothetical protein